MSHLECEEKYAKLMNYSRYMWCLCQCREYSHFAIFDTIQIQESDM